MNHNEPHDFYYSADGSRMSRQIKTEDRCPFPCFVTIDGVEHHYTETIAHGHKPGSQWDDLKFLGTAPMSAVRVGRSNEWPALTARLNEAVRDSGKEE